MRAGRMVANCPRASCPLPASATVKFSRSSEAASSRQKIPYRADVPLTGLPEGAYILRVDVRSRLGSAPSVVREIPFTIQ